MRKAYLTTGLILGIIAIILGAFGAHSLKEILSPEKLNSFEVGVRYQMYHALLLIILSSIKELRTKPILILIIVGILMFSFSIYILSLNGYLQINQLNILGPVTPIGGSILIVSWSLLLAKAIKKL